MSKKSITINSILLAILLIAIGIGIGIGITKINGQLAALGGVNNVVFTASHVRDLHDGQLGPRSVLAQVSLNEGLGVKALPVLNVRLSKSVTLANLAVARVRGLSVLLSNDLALESRSVSGLSEVALDHLNKLPDVLNFPVEQLKVLDANRVQSLSDLHSDLLA